jgi:hypothetical protein
MPPCTCGGRNHWMHAKKLYWSNRHRVTTLSENRGESAFSRPTATLLGDIINCPGILVHSGNIIGEMCWCLLVNKEVIFSYKIFMQIRVFIAYFILFMVRAVLTQDSILSQGWIPISSPDLYSPLSTNLWKRGLKLDRTHVPNLHIIMRRRLLGQMMAVTLRQLSASTSSILIRGSVWGFPSIIEIKKI